MIYWDNNATTAVAPEVLDAMLPYLQGQYFNPSAAYGAAKTVRRAVEEAREKVAALVGADASEIMFTGGGTEATNAALAQFSRVLTTATEHPATLRTAKGDVCPVMANGQVDLALWREMLPDHDGVSFAWANHETGVLQPVRSLAAAAHEAGARVHADIVQAAAKVPVKLHETAVDFASVSAHKFHGPKGVGALYCRRGVRLTNFIEGGAQERNRRAGTENLPGICGMAAALQEAVDNMEENTRRVTEMRDRLIEGIRPIPCSRINGSVEHRLPGNVNASFEGIEGESLLLRLDLEGICASSGSACTSGSLDPSHVLLSIGTPVEVAHGSLRLSLDEVNTMEEVEYCLAKLPRIIAQLRDMSPVWEQMKKEGKC